MSGALITRGLPVESIDRNARTISFVASTDAIDSYDEIVEQSWRLERFRSNPVILFGHNSRDLPVGKATRCEVVDDGKKRLECTVQFATKEANPLAEQVWQSLLQGTLRAVSVGFVPNDYRFEKRDGREVFVLSDNELHEISVVPIPANPEALAKMKAKAAERAAYPLRPAIYAGPGSLIGVCIGTRDGVMSGEVVPVDAGAEGTRAWVANLKANGAATPTHRAQAHEGETNMTLEEALARIKVLEASEGHAKGAVAVAEAKAAEAARELVTVKAALAAAEGTVKALETDRDAHKARADKAEGVVIEREVDALVGVKIAPAEKDTFLELARSNPALFTKMVAARPEMKLLGGQVIPDDRGTPPAPGAKGNGAALAQKIHGTG